MLEFLDGLLTFLGGTISVINRRRGAIRRERQESGLCVDCGYDLRGSTTRCPECGKAFKRYAPPHLQKSISRYRFLAASSVFFTVLGVGWGITTLVLLYRHRVLPSIDLIQLPAVFTLVGLLLFAIRRSLRRRSYDDGRG
jgi:hypothetical protein